MDTQNLYRIPQSPCPVSVPMSVPEPTPTMSTTPATTTTTTVATPTQNATATGTTTSTATQNEPKRKKPAGRSTLFWVHSDPQSATEGSREETLKRIRSHVMSEHNRKKRENTKRHAKTWKHLAFQPVENNSPAGPKKAAAAPAPAPAAVATTPGPVAAPATTVELGAVVRKNPAKRRDQRVERGSVVEETIPWPIGGLDPFSVSHTQLSDRMCRHLQHCRFPSLSPLFIPLVSLSLSLCMNANGQSSGLLHDKHTPSNIARARNSNLTGHRWCRETRLCCTRRSAWRPRTQHCRRASSPCSIRARNPRVGWCWTPSTIAGRLFGWLTRACLTPSRLPVMS